MITCVAVPPGARGVRHHDKGAVCNCRNDYQRGWAGESDGGMTVVFRAVFVCNQA